mmetsp:Transcript_50261/g.90305  ORF Transcript_50261/g.90305 Transcript_50261/m.90305 type:complete len:816 (-) Transcript_50261:21-2468(-)|eukprot:CAMPEP_0115049688 /NCGR_PEP_ID=MMETSP0227-20121206/1350_1 /TAXON_ID=89957 /ORGANISM="Polarella glacialis, Strain CCMP 1383" /LENGTH=815 /DNA_ID=CAMNT_0002433425 /DNA_START=159 /DNA_END=2606 /DNA_ORIENTATION=+
MGSGASCVVHAGMSDSMKDRMGIEHRDLVKRAKRREHLRHQMEMKDEEGYKAALAVQATDHYQQQILFLLEVPLFKRLSSDQHPLVASACEDVTFPAYETVFKQGDIGHEFYVIFSGHASVYIDMPDGSSKKVAILGPGDYFGEKALLADEPRSATIVSEEVLETCRITQQNFNRLGLKEKLTFVNRRAAVHGGGGTRKNRAQPPTPKTPEEYDLIEKALRGNRHLSGIFPLTEQKTKQLLSKMWKEKVREGHKIIVEGSLQAEYFYVIQEGKFQIEVTDRTGDKPVVRVTEVMHAGRCFGELALLYFEPRKATVTALCESWVWIIDRNSFKEIMMISCEARQQEFIKYFDGVPMFGPLLANEKEELAQALVEIHFGKGELIVKQGDLGSAFYMVIEGSVDIVKEGAGTLVTLTANAAKGVFPFFGERALLKRELRVASVQVTSELAKCLMLDKPSFDFLMGPLKAIIENTAKVAQGKKDKDTEEIRRDKIFQKDLRVVGLLGTGGFATVELVEHRIPKKKGLCPTYALKTISKGYIVCAGMEESVMNEKSVLSMTNSPFIVQLHETYSSKQYIHFLLEAALGGELYTLYKFHKLWGNEACCRFYAAGVFFAHEHLQQRRIVYRDLKPENVMLCDQGQVKLADFGSAKFVIGKTYTTCGTPDYFAPEVVSGLGHTQSVDWWQFGIFIFELMTGAPPFESEFPLRTFGKIRHGISKISWPPVSKHMKDMVLGLCNHEPEERLGVKDGKVDNIKTAKWFGSFNWKQASTQNLKPPYLPQVRGKKDLSQFAYALDVDQPRCMPYVDPGDGWDATFASV